MSSLHLNVAPRYALVKHLLTTPIAGPLGSLVCIGISIDRLARIFLLDVFTEALILFKCFAAQHRLVRERYTSSRAGQPLNPT